MNIEHTDLSPIEIYNKGTEVQREVHNKAEREKLKVLRGGSAGCIIDGEVVGTSHYKALARFLGYQFSVPNKSQKIFEGGFGNEFTWENKVRSAGIAFKCESDIPLEYKIGKYKVTGRPDMVLGRYDNEVFLPDVGIELKSVASEGTAKKVFIEKKPKDDNFIQACHYMYKFGIPWVLIYSSTSIFKTYEFAKWFYDKNGKRVMSIHNETGDKRNLFEVAEEIIPQDIQFKIGLDNGTFYYLHPDTGDRVYTLVTTEGIDEYYKLIIDMYEENNLNMAKLSRKDMFGNFMYYDPNEYDEYLIMAPPEDYCNKVDLWCDRLGVLINQPYMIRRRSKRYEVTKGGDVEKIFDTKEEAIEFINNPEGVFRL